MFIKAHAVHWNRKHTNKSLQNILTRILSRSKSNYPPRILHSLHNGAHLIRHALLLRLDIAPSRLINTIKTPSDWVISLEKGHFNTITAYTWYSERHKGRTAWNLATWCTMGYSPTLLTQPSVHWLDDGHRNFWISTFFVPVAAVQRGHPSSHFYQFWVFILISLKRSNFWP